MERVQTGEKPGRNDGSERRRYEGERERWKGRETNKIVVGRWDARKMDEMVGC